MTDESGNEDGTLEPEELPYPTSLCHRCAAPPRYVRTKRSLFVMCPLMPGKYPPQPVRFCSLFRDKGNR